ncbi:MAG: nitrite/sulfite reductase, partial [Myxococcales bacterium]|nr:nitrite/sulfite reductase [Myxococcales bacterium]
MYRYSPMDLQFVKERVAEFRDQVRRRNAGELTEDEFRPLRLMNGLYMQRHAYMLRVAIPYGLLSSAQMRKLGAIAEKYDRGFGHFTTRQNLQYNWLKLDEVPDLLQELADVEMNGIQTSGNCVRNITTDPYAGVAPDELLDCRPYCEILRQYVALHPEFMYLPRKFKIAFSGANEDRAATAVHDIGIKAVRGPHGALGFEVLVGGGLGRTPRIGQVVRDFLPLEDLVSYTEAILRVYNLHGRRDNKFKARIKILVGALGIDEFRRQVEVEWAPIAGEKLDPVRVAAVTRQFEDVVFEPGAEGEQRFRERALTDAPFRRWLEHNVKPHRVPGYNVVLVSLKRPKIAPGDVFTAEFDALADLMDRYNQGYCTALYNQNVCFQYIRNADLEA